MNIGIVGAGQAACTLIAELVRGQFSGKILVFNGESHRPYQRPPLSKTWLHNPTDTESIRLLPEPIETHASLEWIHDHVVSIEPDQGVIATKQWSPYSGPYRPGHGHAGEDTGYRRTSRG